MAEEDAPRSSIAIEKIRCIIIAHCQNHFLNFDIKHTDDSLSFLDFSEQTPALRYAIGLLYITLLPLPVTLCISRFSFSSSFIFSPFPLFSHIDLGR